MIAGADYAFFFASLISLFVIVNPFSTASVFLTISRKNTKKQKKEMVKIASLVSVFVLILFAVLGSFILNLFSITLDAFRIAGGVIIASVGWKMVRAKREFFSNEKEKKHAVAKEDVSIVPLAVPMLAGPGSITTAIVLMGQAGGMLDKSFVIASIILVIIASYLILMNAYVIDRYLGETGRKVADRLMGLIVMVVGVQFIVNGIGGILVSWGLGLSV